MVSQTYKDWFNTILNKQRVRYLHDGNLREGCAHVLGLDKDGKEKVLVCRMIPDHAGPEEWRCLRVSDTGLIAPVPGRWLNGPKSHKQRNSCVVAVHIDINQAAEQLFDWTKAGGAKKARAKKKKPRTR